MYVYVLDHMMKKVLTFRCRHHTLATENYSWLDLHSTMQLKLYGTVCLIEIASIQAKLLKFQ
jgi:hypothetical protein